MNFTEKNETLRKWASTLPILRAILFNGLKGFLFLLFLYELLFVFDSSIKVGVGYDTRSVLENTAVEMQAEDIWRHRRSTLKTFDPISCKVNRHYVWPDEWLEVTCTSEDEAGQYWAYTVLYSTGSSAFSPLVWFFKDSPKVREFRKMNAHQILKGA